MNSALPTYTASASWLRENGYAPAPIPPGQSIPPGPWAAMQLNYDGRAQSDDLAAVFTALPRPNGPGGIEDVKATHLVTVTADVRENVRAELEAIIARHAGGAKWPVRVSASGERVYLFAAASAARFTEKNATLERSSVVLKYYPDCVALAADADGRAYEWPAGNLFEVRRAELATLDDDACEALMADVAELFHKYASPPPPKPTPRVPKPIVPAGERLSWANKRAREQLEANGYELAPVKFGRAKPDHDMWRRNFVTWNFSQNVLDYGVGITTTFRNPTLVALELWSQSAAKAEELERLGFSVRTDGILAGVAKIIRRHVGDDAVVRTDSTGGQLFLFRNPNGYTRSEFDRSAGVANTPGTRVALKLTARDACYVVSGDDASGTPYQWSHDLLVTKLDDLPMLDTAVAADILRDFEAYMESGAGLLEPTPAPPKRARKAG